MIKNLKTLIIAVLALLIGAWSFASYAGDRSTRWPAVRAAYLKQNPACEVCGKKRVLLAPIEVHHIVPFHIRPDLELEPSNLISLCRDHHILFGHLMNWKSWNIDVRSDADEWRNKIKNRPL